jgi:hypothetical protein
VSNRRKFFNILLNIAMRMTRISRNHKKGQSLMDDFQIDFHNTVVGDRSRKLEFLSCNRVVSPPLWALPLTHSSSYLQTLCSVADKAREVMLLLLSSCPCTCFFCTYSSLLDCPQHSIFFALFSCCPVEYDHSFGCLL